MALHEVTSSFIRRLARSQRPLNAAWTQQCRRYQPVLPTDPKDLAKEVESEVQELEQSSHSSRASEKDLEQISQFDPIKNTKRRRTQLPASRYQFRPPRYYRGPLHPHQPPRSSDVASREFFAGPFSLPRLEQSYHDTFAPDLMTQLYTHFPPGTEAPKKGERLRQWVGDSPYFKGRPLRGPRGGDVLRPVRKPITWLNIPKIDKITVHTMVKGAIEDSSHLHVAGMVLQAVTGVRPTVHAARQSVASFGIRQGKYLSATCELTAENKYHFLSKVIDIVFPKIKDWKGVKGTSGDSSGTIAFGLRPEDVQLFPEVEVNYDSYPPKMIPGMHVFVETSAKTDYDARMLLQSIGIPFYGKLVD